MPRYNGDIRLDGNLVYPSGAETTLAITATLNESATGMPGSGQIRFVREGNEEGYWYLFNHPTQDLYDFDAASLPSGSRIAAFDDLVEGTNHTRINDQVGDMTLRGLSGITVKTDETGIIDIHASGIDIVASGQGIHVSQEDPSNDGSRVWRISSNPTHLEGMQTNSILDYGEWASGLVKLTSPTGSIYARTENNEVQLDVNYDVILSGLNQPKVSYHGFTQEQNLVVNHDLGNSGVVVIVYDDAEQIIKPDEIQIASGVVNIDFETEQTGTVLLKAAPITPFEELTSPIWDFTGDDENQWDWGVLMDGSGTYMVTTEFHINTNPEVEDSTRQPMAMGALATTVSGAATAGYTSNDPDSRPWATAVVFSPGWSHENAHYITQNRYGEEQVLWCQWGGNDPGDTNIYVSLDQSRNMHFNWGREGIGYNRCDLGTLPLTGDDWYGLYVGHNGARYDAANASAANLAGAFDIRWVNLRNGVVAPNHSVAANWTSTGVTMATEVSGFTMAGGAEGEKSFVGVIGYWACTTLRTSQPMPDETEIATMIRDPQTWRTSYKVGQPYREANVFPDATGTFTSNTADTQIFLMKNNRDHVSTWEPLVIRNEVHTTTEGNKFEMRHPSGINTIYVGTPGVGIPLWKYQTGEPFNVNGFVLGPIVERGRGYPLSIPGLNAP
jgi:hypothetical protein